MNKVTKCSGSFRWIKEGLETASVGEDVNTCSRSGLHPQLFYSLNLMMIMRIDTFV